MINRVLMSPQVAPVAASSSPAWRPGPPIQHPDDNGWIGQVPPAIPPKNPTPPPVHHEPLLPGEGDDRIWDPSNPPLYG